MNYALKLEQFSGPLEKLLELIEAEKLEVTEISLAQVTDDFLKYLKTIEKVEAPILADFIEIASRLILIKSKSLLPGLHLTQDEESQIRELEARLKLYQEIRPAFRMVQRLWRGQHRGVSRPYLLSWRTLSRSSETPSREAEIFYPGKKLTLNALTEALERITEDFKKFRIETGTIRDKVIRIEEKIEEILGRLRGAEQMNVQNFAQKKSRSEIIAIFLAVLHLVRDRMIFFEQKGYFSDIIVRKKEAS